MPTFQDFGLDPTILQALEKMNYKEPSKIQAEAIPLIQQKRDLIVLAQTGSGKTATCAIPVCNRVDTKSTNIQALIVVPTRELALQYATETQKIGMMKNVKAFAIFGGEDATMQLSKLKHGVQVLVATPGRLIDFIYSRSIDLSHVETLILDEADEMLSMGFLEDLEFIIQCLNHEHQTLLFSATMPRDIVRIAKHHMKDPKEVQLAAEHTTPASIDHLFLYCHHTQRDEKLLQTIDKLQPKQAIIFCHSRIQVEKLCSVMQKHMPAVDYLHAGLGQDVRTIITNKFRTGKIRFLVATDVAARGLDFSGVTHVFIYHLSDDADIYVHRSGRTGRYDRAGVVITLVTEREVFALKKVLELINRAPQWLEAPPEGWETKRSRPAPKPQGRRGPPRRPSGPKKT